MRVIVTGATGLLGKYLVARDETGIEFHGISRSDQKASAKNDYLFHQIDVTDRVNLFRALDEIDPQVIIHTAAEGAVDAVEGKADLYRNLNVAVSSNLATYSHSRDIQYVFVSSNAVFQGSGLVYSDDSGHSPVNDYGRLKAEAENEVVSMNKEALIVRPILMYGWPHTGRRLNPVVSWIESLRAGRSISVVDDVWTEPLAVWDCADAIWRAIAARATGGINISGGVRMTLHELAMLVGEVFDLDTRKIHAISAATLTGLAPRPIDTSFDLVRLTTELGLIPMTPAQGLHLLKATESNCVGLGQ
jgi:dTDP-4-dehydrorhamnose reductase